MCDMTFISICRHVKIALMSGCSEQVLPYFLLFA